jgi:hypothetical protein
MFKTEQGLVQVVNLKYCCSAFALGSIVIQLLNYFRQPPLATNPCWRLLLCSPNELSRANENCKFKVQPQNYP